MMLQIKAQNLKKHFLRKHVFRARNTKDAEVRHLCFLRKLTEYEKDSTSCSSQVCPAINKSISKLHVNAGSTIVQSLKPYSYTEWPL